MSLTDGSTADCFIPNLKQGNCYAVKTGLEATIKLDDCSAHRSPIVTKRIDGKADPAL